MGKGKSLTREQMAAHIKANVTIDANGCWLWRGRMRPAGYAAICWQGMTSGHRVSFSVFKHEIPDGMSVCHDCDVKACVNPDHLHLGTHAENIREARERGRVVITGGNVDKTPCDRPLTDRQREILAFMVAWQNDDGLPPTVRTIGAHIGAMSTNAVADHLKALERKGMIVRDGRLRITDAGYAAASEAA